VLRSFRFTISIELQNVKIPVNYTKPKCILRFSGRQRFVSPFASPRIISDCPFLQGISGPCNQRLKEQIGEGNPFIPQSLLGGMCQVLVANKKLCHILHVFFDACVIVREKCVFMTGSSSSIFSANDRISLTLFRRITDNRSVTTGFGFYPETRAEFSMRIAAVL